MLKEDLSAVNVGKTDQTSVGPVVGQFSQGENNFSENPLSSPELFLGFLYLCPGSIALVHRQYSFVIYLYLNVLKLNISFTTGCALTSM